MEEIINHNLIVGNIDNSIYEIATSMRENDIGFMPIVKENKIVGVVTDRDIVVEAVSNCANTNTKIENYMTHRVVSVEKNAGIDAGLDLMATYKVKRILVTEDSLVIGVLSYSNILSAYPSHPKLISTLQSIYKMPSSLNQKNLKVDSFYL